MDTLSIVTSLDKTALLVAMVVFLAAYMLMYKRDTKYKLPRGPFVFPVIGTIYAHTLSIEGLVEGRTKFGEATLLYAGAIRVIMLNSYEAIKEAAITKAADFSNRGLNISFTSVYFNPDLDGVISSDFHERLRHNRSATLTILRNLGVGRSTMEEKILDEANKLCKIFSDQNCKPFDPWHSITCSVANVILHVTFNKKHDHTDPELKQIVKYTDDLVKAFFHIQFIDFIPFLRFIPPFSKTFSNVGESENGMREYMWKYAKKSMDDFEYGHGSNYVDNWLDAHYDESTKKPVFDEDNFLSILRDFLLAGTETTTTSLKWTIIFVANRPDIQDKVYDEINRVVGKDRQVRLSDRNNLPYLEALILEIQRLNTILPVSLPHYTRVDSTIGEYDIPADTMVMFNLHAVHMDKEVFGDPEVFRPERFIDDNGKFIKHSHVIPFSLGKRSCLGELLARQELFLFTAALMQNFQFVPPDGVNKLDEEGIVGFTYGPKPFAIRALSR